MSVQFIKKDGEPEWVVLPVEEYLLLVDAVESMEDLMLYQEAMETSEEIIPGEVVDLLLQGENPIRVWRTFRGISQHKLAHSTNISESYLSQLEGRRKTGTIPVMDAIAEALNVSLEEIMPFRSPLH